MRHCTECSSELPPAATTCPNCEAAVTEPLPEPATEPEPAPSLRGDPEQIREELAEALKPDFVLLRQLGRGGMGWVFLAREPALKRLVAVKLLAPHLQFDERSRSRFEREARAAAVLSHPNLVQIYRIGETGRSGLPYIVMQYIEGPSLREWLTDRTRATERDARHIVGSVASALAAAHRRGLVHRDVKPANILIETSTGRIFLTDFGIAAALSPAAVGEAVRLTDTNSQIGTPAYMSPEQALGERVTPRSDVYGLGMLAYELLAGALPFQASTTAGWTAAHLRDTPVPVGQRRPDIPAELALLIDQCLAKSAEDRPEAEEIARGLLPSLESGIEWPPPGMLGIHRLGHRLARSALLTTVAGLLVLWCLVSPPASTLARGQWWERFSSDVRESSVSALGLRRIGSASPQDTLVWIWGIGLLVGLAVMLVGFLATVAQVKSAIDGALAQRSLGWRLTTVLDTLADPDGRSGLLLAGEREFASITGPDREAILESRRRLASTLSVSGLGLPLILGAWALWAASGLSAPSAAGPAINLGGALLIAILPIALAAVGLLAGVREAGAMGPLPRRRQHTSPPLTSAADPTLAEITAWYQAVGQPESGDGNPPARPGSRIPGGFYPLLVVLSLLLIAGLGLQVGATLVAARNVRRLGPATAELADSLNAIERDDPLGAARRIWRPYVPLPSPSVTASPSSARLDTLPAAIDTAYPAEPGNLLEALGANPNEERPEIHVLRRGLRRELQGDTLRLLQQMITPSGAGRQETATDLNYPRLRQEMQLNLLGAAVALNRSDFDLAMEILGRNGKMAEALLDSPETFDVIVGAGALQSMALRPLALLIESRGDSATAARLRAAAARVMGYVSLPAWNRGVGGLAADPDDWSIYARMLVDHKLLPAHRLAALGGASAAYCLNAREIAAGPSPARHRALLVLADSMTDLPRAHDLALRQPPQSAWPVLGGLVRLAECRHLSD